MRVVKIITKLMNVSMYLLTRHIKKTEKTIEATEKKLEESQTELVVSSNLKAKLEALGC